MSRRELEGLTELVEIEGDEPFILHPGEFVLGSTLERVALPDDLVARLEGKSSLGRLGLLIHSTAGFIDPGWDGHVTLELSNVANLPITIYPEMKIGQLSFVQLLGAGGATVRVEWPRLEVPGPARADAEPLLEELRGPVVILVTGATGFVGGHVVRALVEPASAFGLSCATRAGRTRSRASTASSCAGDVTDPEPARRRRRVHDGRPSRRDPHGQACRLRARDDGKAPATLLDAARRRGRARFVHMSALGTSEATKDTVPYYRAKWASEEAVRASGLGHAILRPSFVFARRRRRPRPVRADRATGAGDARDRERDAAAPADLGGRPGASRHARRASRATISSSSSAGPTSSTGTSSGRELKAALGTRRPSLHVPFWFMRPQAAIIERLPQPSGDAGPAAHAPARGQRRLGRRREHGPAARRAAAAALARSRQLDERAARPRRRRPVSAIGVGDDPDARAGEKARAAFRRPSIPVASVGFGRGASCLAAHPEAKTAGGAERASPTLGYGDSPMGLGNTPLPAGTSTAGTAGICHVRTTSFPR